MTPVNHHAAENLMKLPKNELLTLCRDMELSVRKSWRKDQLTAAVTEAMLADPAGTLLMFRSETLELLRSLLESFPDGVIDSDEVDEFEASGLIIASVTGLIDIFDDKYVMTDELIALLSGPAPDKREQALWDETELCALGILATYGVLPMEDLKKILSRCYPSGSKAPGFMKRLIMRAMIKGEAIRAVDPDGKEYICEAPAADSIGKYLHAVSKLDYRYYSKDQYIKAASDGIPAEPANYDKILEYIEARGSGQIPEQLIFMIILQYRARIEDTSITDLLMSQFIAPTDPDKLGAFLPLWSGFINSIPLWILKGRSQAELTEKHGTVLEFKPRLRH